MGGEVLLLSLFKGLRGDEANEVGRFKRKLFWKLEEIKNWYSKIILKIISTTELVLKHT